MSHIVNSGILTGWDGCDGKVSIPEGVLTIGKGAFRGNMDLCAIALPESIKTIGDFAFEGCRRLEQAALPNGLKRLGNSCFKDCIALRHVELPKEPLINSAAHLAAPFPPCISCRFLDLPPVNLRNLQERTTKNSLAS